MNTDLVVVIILSLLAIFSFVVLIMIYIPVITKKLQRKPIGNELETSLQEFQNTNKPGRIFVHLIKLGHFSCIKTGNHGNDFPDKRQLYLFKKYSSDEIAKAIDEIGDFK